MAAVFVLLLASSIFHGYVSGYPTTGMLKIVNMCLSRFSYCVELTAVVLATLVRDKVL